jgi:putative acetyltransferase
MASGHTDVAFSLRRGVLVDARAILEAHRSAVRGTASAYYSQAIIDEWGAVDIAPERITNFERQIERGEEVIVVAVVSTGHVIGFGSIVPSNSELRAVYVAAEFGRRGVGRAILRQLETLARDAGVNELSMDASINAVPFYTANGFISLGPGEHPMPSGNRMACMRMSKSLG